MVNLLLVEDNPADVLLFQSAMKWGANIHVVTDGADAFDRLLQRGSFQNEPLPDLVVMDLNIPLLSGHDIVRVLKSNARTRRIPVIVWSASENPEDIERAFDLGACTYVTKMVDPDRNQANLLAMAEFWLDCARYPSLQMQPV